MSLTDLKKEKERNRPVYVTDLKKTKKKRTQQVSLCH